MENSNKPKEHTEAKSSQDNLEIDQNDSEPEKDQKEQITNEDSEVDESWIDNFKKYLSFKGILSEDDGKPVLKEPTIDSLVEYIKSGNCKYVITMAGAGISTSAGIPDFRSPGSGLYNKLSKYKLSNPEIIFSIDYFNINPEPFFHLAREIYPKDLKPTISHYFIRLLHEKKILLRHYTQNIDNLDHIAGIPDEKIVESHGTFRTSHCRQCQKEYNQEWMKDKIFSEGIPHCEVCSGIVKPDIVFFGEGLPENFFNHSETDFEKCDMLIVMGTSLTVQPFASLVNMVKSSCPRVLINKENLTVDPDSLESMVGRVQIFDIDRPENKRDVGLIGDCDEQCSIFADKLGWKDELDSLTLLKKL